MTRMYRLLTRLNGERANIKGLDLLMRPGIIVAGEVYEELGYDLPISCGRDGEHGYRSLHPYGRAIDLDTSMFSDAQRVLVVNEIRAKITGQGFDVVDEGNHIHIEYDSK